MNFPLHRIHDPRSSYGRLVVYVPFVGRWLALFDDHGLRLTYPRGFHNCTRTGIS